MGELEEKLIEALARAMTAEKIADRALSLAQEALMKVEALKNNQVASYAYPNYGMEAQGLEPVVAPVPAEEAPPIEGGFKRISPFSVRLDDVSGFGGSKEDV